jgi:coatomer subunit delta
MVILAASVCTKTGEAVVSRQFVEMTRSRIEGLLASFPKLIVTDQAQRQHTFVETDAVRFLYQPLDSLYMVLITNRQSNILQDIGTLALFSRTVGDYCRSLKEGEVQKQAYELLMAFDEICTTGGYRESVTLQQIRANTEMDSHEERLQEMLQKVLYL